MTFRFWFKKVLLLLLSTRVTTINGLLYAPKGGSVSTTINTLTSVLKPYDSKTWPTLLKLLLLTIFLVEDHFTFPCTHGLLPRGPLLVEACYIVSESKHLDFAVSVVLRQKILCMLYCQPYSKINLGMRVAIQALFSSVLLYCIVPETFPVLAVVLLKAHCEQSKFFYFHYSIWCKLSRF